MTKDIATGMRIRALAYKEDYVFPDFTTSLATTPAYMYHGVARTVIPTAEGSESGRARDASTSRVKCINSFYIKNTQVAVSGGVFRWRLFCRK